MLDIQFIRENPELVAKKAKQKGYDIDVGQLLQIDDERKKYISQADRLRSERNEHAAALKSGKPTPDQIEHGKTIKNQLTQLETKLGSLESEYWQRLKAVPNMPLDDVPVGTNEAENVVAKTVGEVPQFDFEPKNHAEIAEALGWLDKERAAKVTGARFAYLKGDIVRLQIAIMEFAIDTVSNSETLAKIAQTNNLEVSTKPFVPVLPPLMIRTDMYDAMDRLEPRDDRYKIEGEELWLQGSAEHVLGSMHAGEIIDESDFPIRYLGYAASFRKEAGTYGKDMEGIFRMHQFDKLELESLTTKEDGLPEHYFMVAIQEYLMQCLGIPFNVLLKCTADIGKPNARGVDIDAWLPGQNNYRETHTADYMTDYQARRLKTRVRRKSGETELVHTNDATAFALSRTLIAIIENYQTSDGHVRVPEVLRPYLGGKETL